MGVVPPDNRLLRPRPPRPKPLDISPRSTYGRKSNLYQEIDRAFDRWMLSGGKLYRDRPVSGPEGKAVETPVGVAQRTEHCCCSAPSCNRVATGAATYKLVSYHAIYSSAPLMGVQHRASLSREEACAIRFEDNRAEIGGNWVRQDFMCRKCTMRELKIATREANRLLAIRRERLAGQLTIVDAGGMEGQLTVV